MSVAVLGEALIDLLIGEDGAYHPHLGGSPYNVAIGLARQGVPVSYLSALSDDTFGDQLHASLIAHQVRVPLQRRSRWPTSLALVTVDAAGQPTYRLYREGIADKDTGFEEIIGTLPDDLRVFHTGSLAITPSQLPKIHRVIDWMHDHGVLVSIDLNIRLGASIDTEKYLDGVRALVPRADIVKASDEDLAPFGLDDNPRVAASRLFEGMNGGVLVLTEGARGAVAYCEAGIVGRSVHPVEQLVDTVGAGDTFHAAFLAFLDRSGRLSKALDGLDVELLGRALEHASAAASINVSRAGCSPPSFDEVVAALAG